MKVWHNVRLVSVWIIAALAAVFCLGGCAIGSGEREWSFDTDDLGAVPCGGEVAETGSVGKTAQWQVIHDNSAPGPGKVVAVTKAENQGDIFNANKLFDVINAIADQMITHPNTVEKLYN